MCHTQYLENLKALIFLISYIQLVYISICIKLAQNKRYLEKRYKFANLMQQNIIKHM